MIGLKLPDGPRIPGLLSSRSVPLEQTFAAAAKYGRRIGITRVGLITGLDRIGVPVAVAYRPNSRTLSVSQGKGISELAAKVSALMESIEAYQAETVTGPLRVGSRSDLCRDHLVCELADLPKSPGSAVDDHTRLLWFEAARLDSGQPILVPFDLVHTCFTRPAPGGASLFNSSTNGLASGNNLSEALLHALCEVIERDATTLWSLGGHVNQSRTRFDPHMFADAEVDQLLLAYSRAQIGVACWDATSDIGVPVVIAVITDIGEKHDGVSAAGMGCHPQASIALQRALTEAAQSRATIISGARDDLLPLDYAISQDRVQLAHDRFLIEQPPDTAAACRLSRVSAASNNTILEDLELVVRRLNGKGIRDIYVADLSPDSVPLSIVRAIVPGLEALSWVGGYVPGKRALAE